MTQYIKNPEKIEENSMSIIESEMKDPSSFTDDELKVVKRVIHTTADFDYEDLLRFFDSPIDSCKEAIGKGCKIYTDTSMMKSGINKKNLEKFGCEVVNYVHDEDVWAASKEKNITRSMASIEKAYLKEKVEIYAIGNAPTALYKLFELIDEYGVYPKAIIGAPVGFVGAAESKEMLMARTDVPYISVKGRKGGSSVSAAIINAIMKITK
ncbi:precorrin-8X methylmutase [Dethiosulfatibacter aminovorans DSM 17477]|uniref:Precorrin-8X methylmutase n=1 Tax=Dethiosulfatibacter aminovorans DSM 17477 TaxID=1121476 RepID=A0A1M6B310_9FIRM|nr:precorrin-8X methylmutase [Dethiosulfatibacter aminovorans]SHI42988.1 precorrin-8X methylmutase [Dethiosulfatibacter aminovorans DSM 17477]